MQASRRGFLGGMLAVLAAPAIVRVESLMVLPAKQQLILPDFLPVDVSFVQNDLRALNMIMREAVRLWTDSNAFLKGIDEQYEKEFAAENARIGSTLRITVPKDFILTRESAMKLVGAA